jgi:hypothetical protein
MSQRARLRWSRKTGEKELHKLKEGFCYPQPWMRKTGGWTNDSAT